LRVVLGRGGRQSGRHNRTLPGLSTPPPFNLPLSVDEIKILEAINKIQSTRAVTTTTTKKPATKNSLSNLGSRSGGSSKTAKVMSKFCGSFLIFVKILENIVLKIKSVRFKILS
jgi:hypothetical protein